jgi:GntR family transcriptional regulator, phosphonate transport system regulatory protein
MTASDVLVRREGKTLWRQIAQQIEQDIREQILHPGDQLPTEWELTERFGVNRHTVRRALAALAESGAVRAEQGRGTFVQEGLLDYPITRNTRFSETIRGQSLRPNGEVVRVSEERANGRFAVPLAIASGTIVCLLEVLRRADDFPMSMATHVFEKARFPAMIEHYRMGGSITLALANSGVHEYSRLQTKVTSHLPSPEETRLLQVTKTRPMLVTESVDVDAAGVPICVSISRFPSDRVQLVFAP